MKKPVRKPEVVVISDVHLGTYGCHARELLQYLKSVKPKKLVLNGDIIDIWQFSKRYWPKSHMKVIKQLMSMVSKGVKVYYITGNHDELLRKFEGFSLGSFQVVNKLVLEMPDGKKAWIFHGDVFDVSMKHAKWLAKCGAMGYDILILLNRVVNYLSEKIFHKGRISFSRKIKNSVKSAVSFINDFESTAATIGIDNNYDYVICGHIHQPCIRTISNHKGKIEYLNSGDWIENLTALEYNKGSWELVYFSGELEASDDRDMSTNELFKKMVAEFECMRAV